MAHLGHHACVLAVGLALAASPAAAQDQVPAGQGAGSQVRVVNDRTTIWSRNPSMVLAIVKEGTVLRALGREDRWIEVVVPPSEGGKGNTGFVLATHVEHVAGTPEIPVRQPRGEGQSSAASSRGRSGPPPPAVGVRGIGMASYTLFQAKDSFDAIFGSAWQPLFGGGAQVVFRDRWFVEFTVEQFKQTGERVAVVDGEVFPLGIDDRVTITPLTFTVGYRLRTSPRLVSYVGGGAGSYRYEETSDFADPSENVDERHTSFHALGGVEFSVAKWVLTAFEVKYASVPDALGAPGVSGQFGETNLGGLSLGVKVLVGR